ncbi:MAG: BamA/TamA family outer membrane protein [Rikenellaceae bacterium]
MPKGVYRVFILAALAWIATSCGVTRNIPQGEYLLQKVKIESDSTLHRNPHQISSSVLDRYVRQSPNKKFFGTNLYVWIYNSAKPDKNNAWNRLKRRMGEAPVIYNESLTERSVDNIETFMRSQGYYSNSVSYSVDTTSRDKRAYVTYRVTQGEPYIISDYSYLYRDSTLRNIIEADTANSLVRVGELFNATILDAERDRVATILRNKGYFNFTVNNIEYIADTLSQGNRVKLQMVVKRHVDGYDSQGRAIISDNKAYAINSVNIIPNFDPTVIMSDTSYLSRIDTLQFRGMNIIYEGDKPNISENLLRKIVPIKEQSLYDASTVEQTYKNLMSLGYFRSARISFVEDKEVAADSLTFLGVESPHGGLACNIMCTPSLRQSFNVELEGSTTSTFYGLSATIGYQNRNIFRRAELFDASATISNEFIKSSSSSRNAYEYGFSTGLSFPRFIIPFMDTQKLDVSQPQSRLGLSINYQDKPYYRRTLSSITWDYSWRNKYSSFSLAPFNINFVNMGYLSEEFAESLENIYLQESYQSQLITGLSFAYIYNNQPADIMGNATMLRIGVESSGNLVDGVSRLVAQTPESGYYDIWGVEYAQYIRADFSLSQKIMLSSKTSLAGRLYAGLGCTYGNSQDKLMPVDRLFYVGGSNSMRGWAARTLGPGSTPEPEDVVYPSQLGDMRLEANLELRFPIWNILNGTVFFDAGNVWYIRDSEDIDSSGVFKFNEFYKQLGFNTGVGLRLDVQFVILRLDWGLQLYNPNLEASQRWIGFPKWKYSALNFGVGYPF